MAKYRELLPEELAAVKMFAADKGAKWKEALSFDYWMKARIYRGKDGNEYPVLHKLRNELGPKWLVAFKLNPVLKVDGSKLSRRGNPL
jgi:hypothetical protein